MSPLSYTVSSCHFVFSGPANTRPFCQLKTRASGLEPARVQSSARSHPSSPQRDRTLEKNNLPVTYPGPQSNSAVPGHYLLDLHRQSVGKYLLAVRDPSTPTPFASFNLLIVLFLSSCVHTHSHHSVRLFVNTSSNLLCIRYLIYNPALTAKCPAPIPPIRPHCSAHSRFLKNETPAFQTKSPLPSDLHSNSSAILIVRLRD